MYVCMCLCVCVCVYVCSCVNFCVCVRVCVRARERENMRCVSGVLCEKERARVCVIEYVMTRIPRQIYLK